MTYATALKAALYDHLGKDWLSFYPRWDANWMGSWQGPGRKPVAIVLHHTAGAATSSTNPKAPGNQKGANQGQVDYIARHFSAPASNFVLDRDGTVYVIASQPCWHSGVGKFTDKPWTDLRVPANEGNTWMLGVEIVDKGLAKTFTEAQKDSLVHLMRACRDASGWQNIGLLRRPQHRNWTTRKIDLRYSNDEVGQWILKYGFTTV